MKKVLPLTIMMSLTTACASVQESEKIAGPKVVKPVSIPKITTPETIQTEIQKGVLDKIKEMAELCGISVDQVQRTARIINGKVEWDFNSWTVMMSVDPNDPGDSAKCSGKFIADNHDVCSVSYSHNPYEMALHCKEQ